MRDFHGIAHECHLSQCPFVSTLASLSNLSNRMLGLVEFYYVRRCRRAEGIFKMLGIHRVRGVHGRRHRCCRCCFLRIYNIVAHFTGICWEEESACYNGGVAASARRLPQWKGIGSSQLLISRLQFFTFFASALLRNFGTPSLKAAPYSQQRLISWRLSVLFFSTLCLPRSQAGISHRCVDRWMGMSATGHRRKWKSLSRKCNILARSHE